VVCLALPLVKRSRRARRAGCNVVWRAVAGCHWRACWVASWRVLAGSVAGSVVEVIGGRAGACWQVSSCDHGRAMARRISGEDGLARVPFIRESGFRINGNQVSVYTG
jgi:hypothetical protein